MLERDEITRALRDANGNVSKAAKLLGASRRTLQNRMRAYGLAPGKSGRPKRRLLYGKKRKLWVGGAAVAAVVGGVLLIRKSGSGA